MSDKRQGSFLLGGKREIGEGHPVFIIAELGNNHQGDCELAKKTIEKAAKTGADAVSFQYVPLGNYCIKSMHEDERVRYLKECEFSMGEFKELKEVADSNNLLFSISVEDYETLTMRLWKWESILSRSVPLI